MKVEVALEESLTNKRDCYVVFNDTFRIKIRRDLWLELADYLGITVR